MFREGSVRWNASFANAGDRDPNAIGVSSLLAGASTREKAVPRITGDEIGVPPMLLTM